ncbi:MAG: glutamine synthetase [Rhodobacteraceae bacterium]|nr:glutamine synthetase [Paracoccaceae bacterium]
MTDAQRLRTGSLAGLGLLDDAGIAASAELLERIGRDGIETLRVLFADQHGILRGKTVVASAAASVLAGGLAAPSTLLLKDTSHRTVFPVWSEDVGIAAGPMRGAGDILLVPDPATYRVLPWAPHSAWVLCDAVFRSGRAIPFAPRGVLRAAEARLAARGARLVVGLEVEFHVYQMIEDRLDHRSAAMPHHPPETRNLAQGWQFLTETRYGDLEEVMDRLRRCCEALGLPVRSMEVEMGPSQFEFTFEPDSPMAHADNMVMFRTMVKEVAAHQGLHATFMCRPRIENGAASGWHLHQSLVDGTTGRNLFMPGEDGALTPRASQWIAGLLEHAGASCLLSTPTVNGYKRYQPYQLAPDRIQWGRDNRGAMIRGLMAPHDSASRIENRVAETTANPYYFFASQILCGLDGMDRGLTAPPPVETPYDSDAVELPKSLIAAIERFEASAFYRKALGADVVDYLVRIKRAEWNRYLMTVSEWEQTEYFALY